MKIPVVVIQEIELFPGQKLKAFDFENNDWVDAVVVSTNNTDWTVTFQDEEHAEATWVDNLANVADTSQYRDWEVKK